jgi:general secretion pathway protein A
MYLQHYGLNAKPFQITTDPDFLWLGEKHAEALATLKYGILENKGFLLLTGDVGTGKTALINRLLKIIDVSAIVATIPDPGLESLDFFNLLAEEFQMKQKFASKGAFLIAFKQFLHKAGEANKKVLLIIDEAQRLDNALLEQIRLLSNIELFDRKLINIFFVGQTEFNRTLMEDRNRAVRQRITISYHLEALTEKETQQYIRHRLKVAGATREIFAVDAVREIYAFSRGYPRLINVICDRALLTGYAAGVKLIDAAVVTECAAELRMPANDSADPLPLPAAGSGSDHARPPAKAGTRSSVFVRRAMIFVVILAIFAGIGYLFQDYKVDNSPRWRIEDIAPQKIVEPSLQDNETLPPLPKMVNPPAELQEPEPADLQKADAVPTASTPEKHPIGPAEPVPTSTPEPAAAAKDESGDQKPVQDAAKAVQNVMPFPDRKIVVYFKQNSNDLPDEAYQTLDRIAEFMSHRPDAKVSVKGYSDSTGSYSYNVSVSEFRSNMIKTYLVGRGVNPSRIEAVGLGPQNPIASNATAEGRSQNRRVEIELDIPE